jgi:hypothetical protein
MNSGTGSPSRADLMEGPEQVGHGQAAELPVQREPAVDGPGTDQLSGVVSGWCRPCPA